MNKTHCHKSWTFHLRDLFLFHQRRLYLTFYDLEKATYCLTFSTASYHCTVLFDKSSPCSRVGALRWQYNTFSRMYCRHLYYLLQVEDIDHLELKYFTSTTTFVTDLSLNEPFWTNCGLSKHRSIDNVEDIRIHN